MRKETRTHETIHEAVARNRIAHHALTDGSAADDICRMTEDAIADAVANGMDSLDIVITHGSAECCLNGALLAAAIAEHHGATVLHADVQQTSYGVKATLNLTLLTRAQSMLASRFADTVGVHLR